MNQLQNKIWFLIFFTVLLYPIKEVTPQELKIGDLESGSRARPIHLIKLFDSDSLIILKDDLPMLPFSTRNTCGACHSYDSINTGIHFNFQARGKGGEPWLFTDPKLATIIPVSYGQGDGIYNPEILGMSALDFLDKFGSSLPGGGVFENPNMQSPENYLRWDISGNLEINCLACHDASSGYDPAEYAYQIKSQNYKWAAAAGSDFAEVEGSAKAMPDNFDPYNANTYIDLDLRSISPPVISYNKLRFDQNNKVLFDITGTPSNDRCYFCHSSVFVEDLSSRWKIDRDVHIMSGMNCVDCHRNGLDHKMTVGKQDGESKNLSCAGCHLRGNDQTLSGLSGAPYPEHKGFPAVHFEKLECTVCHSGKIPNENAGLIRTSRAHKIGLPGSANNPGSVPHIFSPVFAVNNYGMMQTGNLVTPSFWGRINENTIVPIKINLLDDSLRSLIKSDSLTDYNQLISIERSDLLGALKYLQACEPDSQPVFVSGGEVFVLNDDEEIEMIDDHSADPFIWSTAHDVRPAAQALGANGCSDCHSLSSNFFFGEAPIESAVEGAAELKQMTEFQNLSGFYQKVFSLTFYFRPFLKLIIILSFLFISFIFFIYTGKGFFILTKNISEKLD